MLSMSIWKFLGILFSVLLAIGVFFFARQTFLYYEAIKRGETNPFLEEWLQSTASRLIANQKVTAQDLAALADSTAPSLGPVDAPLTIVEFLDYACPFSRTAFESVREAAVDHAGEIRLVIRDFPLEDLHPGAIKASMAARCAQKQGNFWAYHDKLFLFDQRSFVDADLTQIAQEIGLDVGAFVTCLDSEQTRPLVEKDLGAGLRAGVQGTPTFYFNGVKVQGSPSAKAFNFIIDRFLEKAETP
jgi:protein-disulfide isomerase